MKEIVATVTGPNLKIINSFNDSYKLQDFQQQNKLTYVIASLNGGNAN